MILSCDVLCQFHLNLTRASFTVLPFPSLCNHFLPPPPPQDHPDIGLDMLLNDMDSYLFDEDPFLNDETSLCCSASDTKNVFLLFYQILLYLKHSSQLL